MPPRPVARLVGLALALRALTFQVSLARRPQKVHGPPFRGLAPEVPSEDALESFLSRISARFKRAREEAARRGPSAFLQSRGRAELTIGILTSPSISYYANASTENWRQYAALHGYDLHVVAGGTEEACGPELAQQLAAYTGRFASVWGKVCLLKKLLRGGDDSKAEHSKSGGGYVMVIDADTFIQQPDFSIMDELVHGLLASHSNASGLMFDDRASRNDYPGCWGSFITQSGVCRPNSFLMLFRRDPEARHFARRWLDDALSSCSDYARQFPPTQNVLWHCTLPETLKLREGFLHVHNGMDRFYTMSVHNQRLPLVHFQGAKSADVPGVDRALARANHVLSAAS